MLYIPWRVDDGHQHHQDVAGRVIGAQLVEHLVAVDRRHEQVQSDQVDRLRAGQLQASLTLCGDQNPVAGPGQVRLDDAEDVEVVLDSQHRPGQQSGHVACAVRGTERTRDLLGLLHADPLLAAEYTAVRARRIAAFTDLARAWRARGVIRPLDDATVADLVQALWLIAETWLAFGELDGDGTDAEDGTRFLRVVLRPYLTADDGSRANV